MKSKVFVYILKSIKNNKYYIGSSFDVNKRFKQHNSGKVTYTKNNRPYALVFNQEFDNRIIARKVERKIKNWKRKDFIDKIIKNQIIKFNSGM